MELCFGGSPKQKEKRKTHTVGPVAKSLRTTFSGIYFGELNHSRACERCCEMDFVHPQYEPMAILG